MVSVEKRFLKQRGTSLTMSSKIFLCIPVIILLLFSGCLGEWVVTPLEIVQSQTYKQDEKLNGLTFSIPFTGKNPINVSASIEAPDGRSLGTYSKVFTQREDCFVPVGRTLYHPGIWTVSFVMKNESILLEGNHYFWVSPKTKGLYEFELVSFDAPSSAVKGSTIEVAFTVRNVGLETGVIPIVLYNKALSYGSESMSYGETWYTSPFLGISIEDDFSFTHSVNIRVEEDLYITLMYGEKEVTLEVKYE